MEKYEAMEKADPRYQAMAEKLFEKAGLSYKPDVRYEKGQNVMVLPFPCGENKDRIIITMGEDEHNVLSDRKIAAVLAHETGHMLNRDARSTSLNARLSRAAAWGLTLAFSSVSWPLIAGVAAGEFITHRLAKRFDEDRADHNSLGLFPQPVALKRATSNITHYIEGKGYWDDPELSKRENKMLRVFATAMDHVWGAHTPHGKRFRLIDERYEIARHFYEANGMSMKAARDEILPPRPLQPPTAVPA